MDIFMQKDSTCFPYRLKLNHHKIIKGVKQVQNNITTLLLGIQMSRSPVFQKKSA